MSEKWFEDIWRSSRIGADERLEAHITQLHELDLRLFTSAASATCDGDRAPERLAQLEQNLPQVTGDHIDIVSAAFCCDLARVVTLQLSPGTDTRRFMFFGDQKLIQDHHLLSHTTDGTAEMPQAPWHRTRPSKAAHNPRGSIFICHSPSSFRMAHFERNAFFWKSASARKSCT
ncbi:MAG: DUF1552 domain-containing protein [Myxococcales bacterium]|nr:DUF1552 domain-containing protein [Myxococcales bacterium]